MRHHGPLLTCSYLLGVFPYAAVAGAVQKLQTHGVAVVPRPTPPERFRLRWVGVALKAVHVLLFWTSAAAMAVTFYHDHVHNHRVLKNKLTTTSPLNVNELYVYMVLISSVTTAVCQVHMALPSVVELVGECLLLRDRWAAQPRATVWRSLSAFAVVAFVAYEAGMYWILCSLRFEHQYLICLFPFLSNIDCIMVEQFFYIMCLTLYLRLQQLHEDIQNLVHKAEYPRWKCRVNSTDGGSTRLGIPAFSVSDIRNLRNIHLKAMEMFLRVNNTFQLPLLLNLLDNMVRIIVFTSELAYHLTYILWNKNITINYARTIIYAGYNVIRIIRLWYLHSCENYITKKIIPIRISLSWLTLTLNPVTSRRLMPEIILFQNQLDTISSKFNIYGMININMAFFYTSFGLLMAYVMFLLEFLGSTLSSSQQFNNITSKASFLENTTTEITMQNSN